MYSAPENLHYVDFVVKRIYDGPQFVGNTIGFFVNYELNEESTCLWGKAFGVPKNRFSEKSLHIHEHTPISPSRPAGYRRSLLEMIADRLEYQIDGVEVVDRMTPTLNIDTANAVVAYRMSQENMKQFLASRAAQKRRRF